MTHDTIPPCIACGLGNCRDVRACRREISAMLDRADARERELRGEREGPRTVWEAGR